MVYSTCSILACENEEIIQKMLQEMPVELVPIQLEKIEQIPQLPVSLQNTLCVCPSDLYEGFFVAKLRKK